jgi:hypothetical protein
MGGMIGFLLLISGSGAKIPTGHLPWIELELYEFFAGQVLFHARFRFSK